MQFANNGTQRRRSERGSFYLRSCSQGCHWEFIGARGLYPGEIAELAHQARRPTAAFAGRTRARAGSIAAAIALAGVGARRAAIPNAEAPWHNTKMGRDEAPWEVVSVLGRRRAAAAQGGAQLAGISIRQATFAPPPILPILTSKPRREYLVPCGARRLNPCHFVARSRLRRHPNGLRPYPMGMEAALFDCARTDHPRRASTKEDRSMGD